ncbi:hypothetical protein M9H77_23266 [Catharanthus roseus]|uniref:Uncharacterized protein n=1 Tax=Catharanthus roseus TaxID=4058 RepID=A0ACC0ASI7_CATRO|nr:hypothetical protein M9H77_23266 [Catharanthus roseus]
MDPNLWIVRMTMWVPSYYEVHQMCYLWTIPPHHVKEGIHILVEFEQIQQYSIPITHDKNTTSMTKHITALTQMVSDEPCMLYTTVNNDFDDVDESDEDDTVSSQSESDDDNDPEEEELQTPLNPYPNGRAANSSAVLVMGSGSPIDDLVESGTIRLLDWNYSMTDIQLGMRFIDKVQAISAVRKWSISVGREYRAVKSKNNTWNAKCYHHSDNNYCSWYIRINAQSMGNNQIRKRTHMPCPN